MQKEVAVVDELQSVVALLREDLAKERQKCTELELKVHDQENQSEDLQRQLTMTKKKQESDKQQLNVVTQEMDRMRENEQNNDVVSNSSF